MANSGVQILGFALALMGIFGLIIGTILPQWKMSAFVGSNIITAVVMYEGLWMSCAFQSTGQIQCEVYKSMLQLNSAIQATRALMVLSIVIGVCGLGVACMGMNCTNCGRDDIRKKNMIAMGGGIAILIGALCDIVACSWYTHDIVQAFYNPFTPVNSKYEFGAAIFISWAGGFLCLIGGCMLASSCPKNEKSAVSYRAPSAQSSIPLKSRV